ncbi:Protein of unknown function [Halogranum gelatinilyticum]|uniref:Inner membrane protein YgaP-like transmembrane domain-containing protein n=1 Tax=Halogranum gelatinilyticum TaxID=660521 RepID=A0A1G9YX16_9EURY|nr:DUF2892 domain-containing protein [Halogranum gelatinilyticum]SDN13709.1 Protein of unknown function [Halogranum gelatinilyticum]
MEANVGSTDKTVRILVGAGAGIASLAVLAGAVSLPSVASLLLGVVAVLLLGTAFTSKCALYSALGISTR